MPDKTWTVTFVGQAKKSVQKGQITGKVRDALSVIVKEFIALGPYRSSWPNYSKLTDETYHCHLRKGRPTYVICWRITSKAHQTIEVYYAGTHEKAPY